MDEVLVTGERPGPGLWRVTAGTHELWIIATLEPLPKKMTWRSAEVERRIAASQAVLAAPRLDADVGFFRGLTLLPSLFKARKSPDGKSLEEVLPHDLYMRWLGVRVKYLGGSDGDEQLRPMLAALDIYSRAIEQSELVSDDNVWQVVKRIAHDHKIPVVPTVLNVKIEDPKGSIRELQAISRAAEIDCLRKTIDRLETDLSGMRTRANLWALGNIEGLRAASYPDEQTACLDAIMTAPGIRAQFSQIRSQLIEAWLATADRTLRDHESSFAVLRIDELLKADGWLARLRARGYDVQEP